MDWGSLHEVLLVEAPVRLAEHLTLSIISICTTIILAVPTGIILTRPKFLRFAYIVLNLLNLLMTVPPLAFIAIAIPLIGIGNVPAIIALIALSLLPVARNTISGIQAVDPAVKEAAMGMGMSKKKILLEVEMPLALPIIIGGIKTSSVLVVSTATMAAFIGGGGLGKMIVTGMTLFLPEYLIVGAGLGAVLAITIDRILSFVEYKMTPRGLRGEGERLI